MYKFSSHLFKKNVYRIHTIYLRNLWMPLEMTEYCDSFLTIPSWFLKHVNKNYRTWWGFIEIEFSKCFCSLLTIRCFEDCFSLKFIRLSASIEIIGSDCFSIKTFFNYLNFNSIHPKSLKEIKESAFKYTKFSRYLFYSSSYRNKWIRSFLWNKNMRC